MAVKPCIKCGVPKELTEFYKNKHMADLHVNVCKSCKLSYDRGKRLETADISKLFLTWGRV